MARALALAAGGQGCVEPNPMVGAVLVRDGRVVGEGFHRAFGGDHAEVEALRAAGEAARGATLVVTLEPCCHHGKTPPCARALVEAGVARVVAAHADPDPRVRGGGAAYLRRTGIDVRFGVREADARELNAPYLTRMTQGRPWWIAKWAADGGGRIAGAGGRPVALSGSAARREAHALRGRVDAVVVGIGTVLADDPRLTCRDAPARRRARRIVLDGVARTPPGCRLLSAAPGEAPIVVTGPAAPAPRLRALESAGAEIWRLDGDGPRDWERFGKRLMESGATNVLVEGGAGVLGTLLREGRADEMHLFLAPGTRLEEGPSFPGGGALLPGGTILDGARLDPLEGGDLHLSGRLRRPAPG